MEIAKTPYKSIYMTVPKTKFSKFSESIYMPIHIYDGPSLYVSRMLIYSAEDQTHDHRSVHTSSCPHRNS